MRPPSESRIQPTEKSAVRRLPSTQAAASPTPTKSGTRLQLESRQSSCQSSEAAGLSLPLSGPRERGVEQVGDPERLDRKPV